MKDMMQYPRIKEIILRKYEQWSGWLYNFVVIEMDNKDGSKAYGVGLCQYQPFKYLRELDNNLQNEYIPGNGEFYSDHQYPLLEAYKSWKGEKRDKRFERHARYYVVTETFKERDDIYSFARKLFNDAINGFFENKEAQTYIHPVNKWISEETLYEIVAKLYGEKNVIYQYRPSFLKSSKNGQMSYDIFIVDKNIAIEYQGEQHFKPVEIFGGEKAFKEVQKRDKEKKKLSDKNGIKLIYFYYHDELTDSLIKERIDSNVI